MALGVVSHILHPHPDVPPVRELSSPLAGVVAVSPWVTFATTSPSFKENDDSDIISASFINKWGEIAMGGPGKAEAEVAAGRYHAEALQAPESWWTGIGGVTSFLGVTAGKHEVFRDDIVSFVAKVKAEGGKETRIEEFVGARDVHDSLLLEFESGTEPGELTKLAVQWILAAAK